MTDERGGVRYVDPDTGRPVVVRSVGCGCIRRLPENVLVPELADPNCPVHGRRSADWIMIPRGLLEALTPEEGIIDTQGEWQNHWCVFCNEDANAHAAGCPWVRARHLLRGTGE